MTCYTFLKTAEEDRNL